MLRGVGNRVADAEGDMSMPSARLGDLLGDFGKEIGQCSRAFASFMR